MILALTKPLIEDMTGLVIARVLLLLCKRTGIITVCKLALAVLYSVLCIAIGSATLETHPLLVDTNCFTIHRANAACSVWALNLR